VAGGIFVLSLILFALAYLLEKGFTGLSFGTVTAAIATSLLLAAVSVTLEQYIKARLTDHEINTALISRELGIKRIGERNALRGLFSGIPEEVLKQCYCEIVIIAYSAENFVERNREWIKQSLDNGKYIGLLVLDPDKLQQPEETERLDLNPYIQKTLGYCKQIISENPKRAEYLKVRGFTGHLYFGGVFIDRHIVQTNKANSSSGTVCIQLKANFKSHHEGIVLTFNPDSRYSSYYTDSCKEIWKTSKDLIW